MKKCEMNCVPNVNPKFHMEADATWTAHLDKTQDSLCGFDSSFSGWILLGHATHDNWRPPESCGQRRSLRGHCTGVCASCKEDQVIRINSNKGAFCQGWGEGLTVR
jgi:hypothetical protein